MQISPLQVFELSQRQGAASAGIGTWIRRTWAMIKNSIDLRLALFACWVSVMLLYRIIYSFSYPVFQNETPKCTDFTDCSDCLAPNFFVNSTICAWVESTCAPAALVFPGNGTTDARLCPSLSCPVLSLSINGPFVCTSSAQFTFLCVSHVGCSRSIFSRPGRQRFFLLIRGRFSRDKKQFNFRASRAPNAPTRKTDNSSISILFHVMLCRLWMLLNRSQS